MFNIGPSAGADWLKQKTGGNTGITGGMRNRPAGYQKPNTGKPSGNRPFGMGPMPQMGRQPVSTTMPVGRPRPNIIPLPSSGMPPGMGDGMVQQPGQQPIEENQLWRTYNRLLGGSMAPRMLF